MTTLEIVLLAVTGLLAIALARVICLGKFQKPSAEARIVQDVAVNVPARSPEPPARSSFTITDEYKDIQSLIKKGCPIIFVHGGAGTGKSFLIQWLRKCGLIHISLAPTGLAALNINGMTVHKFFGLPPQNIFPKKEEHLIPRDHFLLLRNAKTICIDEISMVRADLLDQIDRSLRSVGESNKIFGGYQMVFVGDLYQLPPVVSDDMNFFFRNLTSARNAQQWDSPWFLDADCLKNQRIERIELTKTFRQTDIQFVENLNQIRKYKNLRQCLDYVNRNMSLQSSQQHNVVLVLTNKVADQINSEKISTLQHQITYPATKTGTFCGTNLKNRVPVPELLRLGEKAFVMILHNDPDGKFVNGSTGTIQSLMPDYADVMLKSGTIVRITPYTWHSYRIEWNKELRKFENVEDGTYTQIPLIPAYAITCHKAQGKTFDSVYLAFKGAAFAPGQTYVALSRVRHLADISADRQLTLADFPLDRRLKDFECNGLI